MVKKTKDSNIKPKETKITEKVNEISKKVTTVVKDTTTTKKASTSKKPTPSKKVSKTAKKKEIEKSESTDIQKVTTTKKNKDTSKKTTSKKVSKVEKDFQTEFYELPDSYNQTMVTILAQTPSTLFVYWELSKNDIDKFRQTYGDNFFEVTTPILIVYNDTLNYSFEVEINDFANSWYIHINDSKCVYHIELGRKPIHRTPMPQINNNNPETSTINNQQAYIPYYVYVSSSNQMTIPNNKILFNFNQKSVTFRNIKNGQTTEKDIQEFKFITNHGIVTISELYKKLHPNEDLENENFFSGNPSSGSTSSKIVSSQFK